MYENHFITVFKTTCFSETTAANKNIAMAGQAMAGPIVLTVDELIALYGLTVEDLSTKVTDELLTDLTKKMNNWGNIVPHLKLTTTEEDDIRQAGRTPEEQRRLVFQRWTEKFGKAASFYTLTDAFLKATRRDLAEEVCDFFRRNIPKQKKSHYTSHGQDEPLLLQELPQESDALLDEQLPDYQATDNSLETNQQQPANQKHKSNTCTILCCWGSCCLFCCLFFVLPIIFIVLATTVYKEIVPPSGSIYILKESVALLQEYDPYHVEGAMFTSTNDIQLYKIRCKDLTEHNLTVEQSEYLNISRNETYPISGRYLLSGSQLDYHFEFDAKKFTKISQCFAYLYVFDDASNYRGFLEHGTIIGNITTQCMPNGTSSYKMNVEETKTYFVGLSIPDLSQPASVNFSITGYEMYFDISQREPDCGIVSDPKRPCTLKFERQNSRDPSNNICILGETFNNPSDVAYIAYGSAEIAKLNLSFITTGGFSLFLWWAASFSCIIGLQYYSSKQCQ